MRTLDSNVIDEKNKQEGKNPITLLTLFDYNGLGSNLYFTSYRENVTFDSQEYTAFPFGYDSITEDGDSKITSVEIAVSNVSRIIQAYLEQYDLRNKKIKITLVWPDFLNNADAKVEDFYYINNYTATDTTVTFTCTTRLDVLSKRLPGRTYSRNSCAFIFKDVDTCKYVGSETSCNKTKQQCKIYDNFINYGATPAVPTKRTHVL